MTRFIITALIQIASTASTSKNILPQKVRESGVLLHIVWGPYVRIVVLRKEKIKIAHLKHEISVSGVQWWAQQRCVKIREISNACKICFWCF